MQHKHCRILYETPYTDWTQYYVYELIDPRTNLPFYVGKGRGDRAIQHITHRNAKTLHKANPHKCNTINKIIDLGLKIVVNVVFVGNEKQSFDHEKTLVCRYGFKRKGGLLTNITNGGEGNTTDGKPVSQFTMWGEFIKTYKNAKEAMLENRWKNNAGVTSCCTGKERSYKGYLWAYEGNIPTLLTTKKPVYQWSVSGELIQIFASASEAARYHNCDPSSVNECANGKLRTCIGFVWSHSKQFPGLKQHHKIKKVRNVTTNELYDSVTLAANALSTGVSNISAACSGKMKTCRGYVLRYE